jgi:hypothetical protein
MTEPSVANEAGYMSGCLPTGIPPAGAGAERRAIPF